MAVSPFAPYANATLVFTVSSGALAADANGNMRPGTTTVEVTAVLSQASKPKGEPREGVDQDSIFVEGYITNVEGAIAGEEQKLPSTITEDSPCSATWNGVQGKFWMEFTAPNPYVRSLNIYIVDKFRGWFLPGA